MCVCVWYLQFCLPLVGKARDCRASRKRSMFRQVRTAYRDLERNDDDGDGDDGGDDDHDNEAAADDDDEK